MKSRPSHPTGVALSPLARRVGADTSAAASGTDVQVTGVTLRSQDVHPGDLFAALPGTATHGARFAADAVARGAVAVFTDPAGAAALAADLGVPVVVHPQPRAVL